jgi:c(7)-type cytochrome triheme protein
MTSWKLIPMLVAATLASAAVAADLPRLPKALKLVQASDSPGVVTFNHDMHVDSAKPTCIECHPRRFGILGRSLATPDRPAVTHARMEKGEACGSCHGKTAFNFDDCNMCHKM